MGKQKKTTVHDSEIQDYIEKNNLSIEERIRLEQRSDMKKLLIGQIRSETKFDVFVESQGEKNKKLQKNFDECPARQLVKDAEGAVRISKKLKYFVLMIIGIISGMGGWELIQYLKEM